MVHGRVIRPPAVRARLVAVDEASIRSIPDVRIVRIESFLGVFAKDEWAAIRAARELMATWREAGVVCHQRPGHRDGRGTERTRTAAVDEATRSRRSPRRRNVCPR